MARVKGRLCSSTLPTTKSQMNVDLWQVGREWKLLTPEDFITKVRLGGGCRRRDRAPIWSWEGRKGERVKERGQGGGLEHSSSAWNQSKKSIFNLAVRMAKLAYQQRYHGLNYTKLPPRKGRREVEREVGRGRKTGRWGGRERERETDMEGGV